MNQTLQISPIEGAQPEFISLIQAKAHLKIDSDYEDDLIGACILAAVAAAENYTGIAIEQKVVTVGFTGWPDAFVLGHFPVVGGVFMVKYYNAENVLVELPADAYELYGSLLADKPTIQVIDKPEITVYDRPDAVQFSFVAGMTSATLPKPLYQAMLLQLADFYEFRTDRTEITNRSSMALMRPYKVWV